MKIALGGMGTALTAAMVVLTSSQAAAAQSQVTDATQSQPAAAQSQAAAEQQPRDDRAAALQQLVAQSRLATEQLGQIDDRLAALRRQAADDESRKQGAADEEAAQHAAALEALGTLRQAEAQLATGDSDGVDEELGYAQAVLSGRTRLDVEAAREALARFDFLPARQYLEAALAERRAPR